MESKIQEAGNNIMELKEDKNEQQEISNPSPIPRKNLRNQKKVKYSEFFSDDQDNSEEYETPDEIKQKIELAKKRKRPRQVLKTNIDNNADNNTTKRKRTKKEKNDKDKDNKDNNNEDDQREQNNVNKEKDNEKEGESSQNPDKKNKNNSNTIINLTETLSKYANNETIPNTDLILLILEICLNSSQLGIEKDNSSRAFWEEIGKKPELKPITSKFKPETLRKYWRTIRETKKFKKIVSEIKKYKNELNGPNMKLFASIHAVCEYVSNPGRKMEFYLNKHMTKTSNKSNKVNVNNMAPNEQIDDIVNTFKKYFPKKEEKDILEILFKNNFDIENTFFVLKDEENFENLCFSEKDDEIIKKNYEDKDDKNEEYQKLIYTKGLEGIIRRKEFLFNVKIDRSLYKEKEKGQKDDNLMVVEIEDKQKEKEEKKEEKDEKNKENNQNMEVEK